MRSREVIDFAAIDNDVIHAERPGEVSGVTLINGEPAELVDAHWLFANHVGAAAQAGEQLVCRMPGWRPLDAEHAAADRRSRRLPGRSTMPTKTRPTWSSPRIGEELAEEASDKTIWLRTEPEAAGKKDDSIYRYDRAGLLMALEVVGAGRGK